MNTPTPTYRIRVGPLLLAVTALGCDGTAAPRTGPAKEPAREKAAAVDPAPPAPAPAPEAKRKQVGKAVWFETQGDVRRVLVEAEVCLREGGYPLECLLCRAGTKEHESLLRTAADAMLIHTWLTVAGGEAGHPVRYADKPDQDGKYAVTLPTGSPIQVSLRYEEKGKAVTVPAQKWIKNGKNGKELEHGWVFAGSALWQDPDKPDQPKVYLANPEGAYITVTNVLTAMLDMPVNSPKALDDRAYVPFTERMPALETKVLVVLEPAAKPKK